VVDPLVVIAMVANVPNGTVAYQISDRGDPPPAFELSAEVAATAATPPIVIVVTLTLDAQTTHTTTSRFDEDAPMNRLGKLKLVPDTAELA